MRLCVDLAPATPVQRRQSNSVGRPKPSTGPLKYRTCNLFKALSKDLNKQLKLFFLQLFPYLGRKSYFLQLSLIFKLLILQLILIDSHKQQLGLTFQRLSCIF